MCCDVPAKSFILKTKGHSGFSSCNRCVIEGEYYCNRVCFPYTSIKPKARTREDYVNEIDEDHHSSGSNISKIIELPNFDVVKIFSIDYMHLATLGVMRKLLHMWLDKGPLNVRLPSRKINSLSSSILSMKEFVTADFARKPRSIQDVNHWKATEFRLFLLYIGPIVLKNIISNDCYTNFMAFSVSMTLLLKPHSEMYINYVQELLEYFVKTFQSLYGKENISHNIHNITHICDDYLLYVPLDNISCFPFENCMKELKTLVRKHEKPLEQVIHRYKEKHIIGKHDLHIKHFQYGNDQNVLFKKQHTNGPLIDSINDPQYKCLVINNIHINIRQTKESYILTTSKQIVRCINFAHSTIENEIVVIG